MQCKTISFFFNFLQANFGEPLDKNKRIKYDSTEKKLKWLIGLQKKKNALVFTGIKAKHRVNQITTYSYNISLTKQQNKTS